MANLDRVIDKIIQESMARGEFDNLRGQGKPLILRKNAFADRDWEMAFSMLEQHGFALPWIEDRKEIEESLAAACDRLARTWAWVQDHQDSETNLALTAGEWRKAQAQFQEIADGLNERIDAYNLVIPADVFYRPRIMMESVIARIQEKDGVNTAS